MIRRELYLNKLNKLRDTEEVKVITGVRRCGKTCLLKQIIQELENSGINKENIIYVSFESSKYMNITDYNKLNEIIFEKTKTLNDKVYLLFDEIQNVNNWEKSINSFRVDLNCDIYITGSNSKLLSGNLATTLTGRFISINIYPFSYKELLQYHEEKYNQKLDYNQENRIFQEYLTYGGFPALLKFDKEEKEDYLNDLYNSILIKDIMSNNAIHDLNLFKRLIEYVIGNIGQILSANSISKYLKHEKHNTTPQTIMNYLDYNVNAYILYKTKREDVSGKKILNTLEKYYLIDPGFYHIFNQNSKRSLGQLLENIIYLELRRRKYKVTIGKVNNLEIDFICKKNKEKIYIQVSETILDSKTHEREIKPFEKIKDNYPKYILSLDQIDLSVNGIKHVNIIEFLKEDYL